MRALFLGKQRFALFVLTTSECYEFVSKPSHVALVEAQTHAFTINASAQGIVCTHTHTHTDTHTHTQTHTDTHTQPHTQQSTSVDMHLEIQPAHALKRSVRVRYAALPCVVLLDRRW